MMNGCLIPNTPIAVDFWKIRECPHARVFLLTHLHGDHVVGLTSSWDQPIYCSEVTGKLLVVRHGVRKELINVLELGSPTIVYLDHDKQQQMTLTALDANHCPGSVMFLMEGYFGRILHTGDFRLSQAMMEEPPLSQLTEQIDVLYLDNTYCNARCTFPSREDAANSIIDIIKSHPNYDVHIGLRSLGKEDLLCKIADHFQEYVTVPYTFLETFRVLGKPDAFDVATDNRIQIVPFHHISNKYIERVGRRRETVFILPTALYILAGFQPYANHSNVFVVPYSDHSSYRELMQFVSFLKPGKVLPVVQSKQRGPFGCNMEDSADMTCFSGYERGLPLKEITVPPSVKSFMREKELMKCSRSVTRKRKKQKTVAHHESKRRKTMGVTYLSPVKSQNNRASVMSNKLSSTCKLGQFEREAEPGSGAEIVADGEEAIEIDIVPSSVDTEVFIAEGTDTDRFTCGTGTCVDMENHSPSKHRKNLTDGNRSKQKKTRSTLDPDSDGSSFDKIGDKSIHSRGTCRTEDSFRNQTTCLQVKNNECIGGSISCTPEAVVDEGQADSNNTDKIQHSNTIKSNGPLDKCNSCEKNSDTFMQNISTSANCAVQVCEEIENASKSMNEQKHTNSGNNFCSRTIDEVAIADTDHHVVNSKINMKATEAVAIGEQICDLDCPRDENIEEVAGDRPSSIEQTVDQTQIDHDNDTLFLKCKNDGVPNRPAKGSFIDKDCSEEIECIVIEDYAIDDGHEESGDMKTNVSYSATSRKILHHSDIEVAKEHSINNSSLNLIGVDRQTHAYKKQRLYRVLEKFR